MKNLDKLFSKYNIDQLTNGCSTGNNWFGSGEVIESLSPVDGKLIRKISCGSKKDFDDIISISKKAFDDFRKIPAPKRGELVRQFGNKLREEKELLGTLVSYEMGKSYQEGLGEVQEMIDICDFAVGLSRQLHGLTMHSERPTHRMYEQYHPLGVIGIISAFNFPVAVWSWNAFLAAICGNTTLWKPSSLTPLCAIAVQNICNEVTSSNDFPNIFSLAIGSGSKIGESLIKDEKVPLISFTGSTRMGRHVSEVVSKRFGKSILELGGNNCIIVDETADMNLVVPAVVFGAVGTAGQRCTSTRRLIVHESIYEGLVGKLINAYKQVKIGDPLSADTLMGPLINQSAVKDFLDAIKNAEDRGGEIIFGGKKYLEDTNYVLPTIIRAQNNWSIVQEETFAPILYVMTYRTLDEAIEMHNDVPQGLSSAMFTQSVKNSELFLSSVGSDCGIANINIGTSGAEIGGAFGGEKETGGGRESGSDSWKQYMRRQTNTINWSDELPLAQGIEFNLES